MIFKDIWVLLFIPLAVAYIYFLKKKDRLSSIRFSSGELFKGLKPTAKIILAKNLIYLRLLVIILFIIALARPRAPLEETKIRREGIDIVLAIDCSGSMLAEDFKIEGQRKNRLGVVKGVVEDFIKQRTSDRIGLVAFAARAYTVCPLTLDYDWLIRNLQRVNIGSIEDGTAVGSAIASSVNRLKDTPAKSKIIILLTDGINNVGNIPPLTSAKIAKALGIKIYTIGVGSKGFVPYPVKTFWGEVVYQNVQIEIDEEILKNIAQETGAKYFRALDTQSLEEIYKEIDKLEKTPIQESGFQQYRELFSLFLWAGLSILILEVILSNTILRKIP